MDVQRLSVTVGIWLSTGSGSLTYGQRQSGGRYTLLNNMEGNGEQVKKIGNQGRHTGDTSVRANALKQQENKCPFFFFKIKQEMTGLGKIQNKTKLTPV